MSINAPVSNDPMGAIHRQLWYHGMRSRNETTKLFKNEGDFLVRTSTFGKHFNFILCVCVESKNNCAVDVAHMSMKFDFKKSRWGLSALRKRKENGTSKSGSQMEKVEGQTFLNVIDLIEHYRQKAVYRKTKLIYAIPRPKWIIPTSFVRFVKGEALGEGNFAKVVKAQMKTENRKYIYVAVKILLQSNIEDTTEQERDEERDAMMREAKVMQKYKHNNVVKFFGVACDKPPMSLVLEFCPGGSLESHLVNLEDGISASERVQYILESARGLRYLHHHNCIHRDLAARNCLISAEGIIKIADFGLSKVLDKNDIGTDEDNINKHVPLRWMAPETISRQPRFSSKSDIWSFAVMCYEIFNNGIKPWVDIDEMKVISKAIRSGNMPSPPSKTPPCIVTLMKSCWSVSILERPEFVEIVELLLAVQEKIPELKPLSPSEYTVNTIPGVLRLERNETAKEILALKSLDRLNSNREPSIRESDESKEKTKSKSKSKESRESKESKESAEEIRKSKESTKQKKGKYVPTSKKCST